MSISAALRSLATAIEDLESQGVTVQDVDTEEFAEDGQVAVALSTTLTFPDVDAEGVDLRPVEASVDGDRIAVEVSVACDADPESDADADPATTGREPTPPHRDPGRLREVYEEHDSFAAMTEALGADVAPNTVRRNMVKHGIHDPEEAAGSEDEEAIPPHRDPERLREVYEEHDSFPEMTEALGADVTPQTVRRRMIEHDIHDPDAREAADGEDDGIREEAAAEEATDGTQDDGEPEDGTASEGDETPEVTLTDGIDLPDGASLEDLKAAVTSARTVHEVGRALGVERDRARRLLDELDLLDLAGGRLAEDHEVPREEIEERIRRAAPGDA